MSGAFDTDFCVEAMEEATVRYGRPEIFNMGQGSQFTSDAFTGLLQIRGLAISMRRKGLLARQHLRRAVVSHDQDEEVYRGACASVSESRAIFGRYLTHYNTARPHPG